jgi:predicted enzyme related to lactoylglutathione lyase
MAADIGMVLDCADPAALAAFWAPALGYENMGEADPYVVLRDPDRTGPKLLLQRVDEAKAGKNRMHLDVHVPDIEAEADRLVALGARRLENDARHEYGSNWILMADPEGNEFCVCSSDVGG